VHPPGQYFRSLFLHLGELPERGSAKTLGTRFPLRSGTRARIEGKEDDLLAYSEVLARVPDLLGRWLVATVRRQTSNDHIVVT
jgi:hypothetical protein